jgi:hypothetical protein
MIGLQRYDTASLAFPFTLIVISIIFLLLCEKTLNARCMKTIEWWELGRIDEAFNLACADSIGACWVFNSISKSLSNK